MEIQKDLFYDLDFFGHKKKGTAPARGPVSEAGRGLISFLQRLFRHAPQNFAGQVDGIIFVGPFDNGFDQPAEHPFHDRLRNAFDLNPAFFPKDPFIKDAFLLIPGEAGEFPEIEAGKRRGKGGLGFGDHFLKRGPVSGMAAGDPPLFNKDKRFGNGKPVRQRGSPDHPQLGVGGQFRLVVGADPDVGGAGTAGDIGAGRGIGAGGDAGAG